MQYAGNKKPDDDSSGFFCEISLGYSIPVVGSGSGGKTYRLK
jgi:hypothetical protein